MTYKRDSFCGPAGDGFLSNLLSKMISETLDWFDLDLEEECHKHDVDWDDGPDTADDIFFAVGVYDAVKKQKGFFWACVFSSVGFVLVRSTAIIFRVLGYVR